MNLIKKLRSAEFGTLVAILSVAVQSFHSYTAFYRTSSLVGTGWGIAQAILFAIVFDIAILFFTLRKNNSVVFGASIFMFIINVYYYYQHLGLTFAFAFGCLLSMILPIMQYYYSEEIPIEEDENPLQAELDGVYKDRDNKVDYIKKLEGTIHAGKADNERLKGRVDEERAARMISEKTAIEYAGALRKLETASEQAKLDAEALIAQRDAAINSNSQLSEILGIRDREIYELRQKLGIIPEGTPIDPQAQRDKTLQDLTGKPRNDEHRPGGYNPTRTDGPTV